MKALTILSALLMASLAVASAVYLFNMPHMWGGGWGGMFQLPSGGGCCMPISLSDFLVRLLGVLLVWGVPTAILVIPLALWGRWQRRRGVYLEYGRGLGNNRDPWLAG
ncbi:MAG: hypothetical protein JSU82_13230 [Rhodospirillales bacterium]|nr:MAG: hypothetical protein JSU82_13230 [Rhodospirillales bacterium]